MWNLIALVVIVVCVVIAILGLVAVRRSKTLSHHIAANDVAGPIFGVVGVLYGALLAFIVFAVWESYSRAEEAVTSEAAAAVAVYRDSQDFPQPFQAEVQAAVRTYLNDVMAREWTSHGTIKVHDTPDLLNPLFELYRSYTPADDMKKEWFSGAIDRLHDLELQRHLRHLSGEATLPAIFWPILIIGSLIIVAFSYFFRQDKFPIHAAMVAMLVAAAVSVLLLIYGLDQPFTGVVAVSKGPMLHALNQFDAIDMPAPIPEASMAPSASMAPTITLAPSGSPAS